MRIKIMSCKSITPILIIVLLLLGVQGTTYAQILTASAASPLTEATLDESIVTLTLNGHIWERFEIHIGNALDVSGIPGVTIGTFGPAWFGVDRISNTQITVELGFEGDFDTDSILTFTVGTDAIAEYNGPALTAQIPVTASMEQESPEDEQDTPKEEPEETELPPTYDYLQGPWLWMIAPGSDIDIDYLEHLSDGAITETQVAQEGVNAGDTLDELQWTSESIYPSTHCGWFLCASNNVQHVVNAAGLSTVKNLSNYTAYALINIVSPRDQNNVKMGVGSDDSVKVWLNGTVVFRRKTSRRTTGIQNRFDTQLKAGNNLLLVKVSEYSGNWGMFFKIYLDEADFTTSTNTGNPPRMEDKPSRIASDVNGDGSVNIQDLVLVAANLGQAGQNTADVNGDGVVDIRDLVKVAGALGNAAAAPSLNPQVLSTLTTADVKKWISEAQQLNLTDTTSQRGVLFLEQLLAALTPKETALLANYPNPFNPETWIPYHLAKDADVTLTIYAIDGHVVRTLAFGHQPAGIYQTRNRAAYWDGRNAFGEPVASGIYFYTLIAGNFTATRKMVIRK